MKKILVHFSMIGLLMAGFTVQSCKGKSKNTDATSTTTTSTTLDTSTAPTTTAPTIAGDDELKRGVTDATKDYPGVTATVNNGEITLTGDIKRDRLPNLMQSLNALNPKKINNNLTIK